MIEFIWNIRFWWIEQLNKCLQGLLNPSLDRDEIHVWEKRLNFTLLSRWESINSDKNFIVTAFFLSVDRSTGISNNWKIDSAVRVLSDSRMVSRSDYATEKREGMENKSTLSESKSVKKKRARNRRETRNSEKEDGKSFNS